MGVSIQDILDGKNPDAIEVTEQWKNTSVQNSLDLSWMDLDSLEGIENLPFATTITSLHLDNNNLTSLVELAKLPALHSIWISENPCFDRYRKLDGENISTTAEILDYIRNVEAHLNKDSDLRGKAALIHSGLFDFNIK